MRPILWMTVALATASAADLFPLREGNSWTYRNAVNGQAFTVSVGSTLFYLNEKTYYSLRGFTNQPVLVRLNELQDVVVFDEETYTERTLVSFQPSDRNWWQSFGRICDEEGQTAERRGSHDGPAGPFTDVVDIQYRVFGCADVGELQEQYAENIGMVRRVINTIAGPRVFDLVEARVNKVQVKALPNGSFTITAADTDTQSDITATLQLRTGGSNPIELNFATGQEFDLVVRDQEGHKLWTWSDGQVFTQALHTATIQGGWSMPVKIPRSVFSVAGPATYTIHGWLTTLDPSPHFGASVQVTVTNP